MNVAVLSDVHDNIWNLQKAIKLIKGNVKAIIFCGDMCAPSTTAILAKANLPTYLCLGNVNEDHIAMYQKGGKKFTWFALSQQYGDIKLGGRKIAFCHYPKLAELLAKTEEHDAVFYGHNHLVSNTKVGKTILVNPGCVCGFNGDKTIPPTFANYNTETNSVEIIKIEQPNKYK